MCLFALVPIRADIALSCEQVVSLLLLRTRESTYVVFHRDLRTTCNGVDMGHAYAAVVDMVGQDRYTKPLNGMKHQ